jgi:hypothetical protein
MNTKHGLFIGFAVLLLAAIFTFNACDNSSTNNNEEDVIPPPASSDATIYTLSGTTFTEYKGNGKSQDVTAIFVGASENDKPISLGKIGTISADGKLTLDNLPVTVEDSKLHPVPSAYNPPSGAKIGVLGITPSIMLYSSDGNSSLMIEYINKDGTITVNGSNLSFKAGWNYIQSTNMTAVTDISSYKWVISN